LRAALHSGLPSACGTRRAVPPFPTRRSSDLIEFENRPPRTETATTGITPATSLAPTPIPDFTINQESLGLSPQFSGGATSSSVTDRKSTRLNSSHVKISYAVFCLKKDTRHRS